MAFQEFDRGTGPMIRRIVASLTVLVAVTSARAASPPAEGGARSPNVIFILADDLGYGGLGCYGQKLIQTPRIDRMAAEGLRFTQAYAGATVCAPSRCVLMTGKHGGHVQVRGNTSATEPAAALTADDVTVAQMLHDAGYATGVVGKWGLGEPTANSHALPTRKGFDSFFGYMKHGHAHNYFTDLLWRNEAKVQIPNGPTVGGVATKKITYSHDLFAKEALQFVREHREGPFFLYLALTIPHCNNEAGDEGMEVPDFGQYAGKEWPEPQKGHAAMMSRMDADVGRLLDLLAELKIAEDTFVVLTSDNGPPRDEGGFDPEFFHVRGPLRGYKGDVSEGGIRVPLIARWPGRIAAGGETDAPICFADVMPTLAELCGGLAPEGIDGVDISPTLFGHEQPELADRFMYWEWNRDGLRSQAARWRQWKAIRDQTCGKLSLYDLSQDIGEQRDLAAERPEIAEKMRAYLASARTESADWPAAAADDAVGQGTR
jgi:arylsulfatase A-like enzyme